MKQSAALFAAVVAVATAQCDWNTVDQTACSNANTQAACFPDGWPACADGAGTTSGQSITDILPASCNVDDFVKCFTAYPDLAKYLTCVHPEPCSCAGDFKVLECADAHCTDKSEYPAELTNNIADCRALAEIRRRQNGPTGGLLTGEDVFPVGPSCKSSSLTPCLSGLAQKYETCIDPFAPCLCNALFDIRACYNSSCTSKEDQPDIVTNNIGYCPAQFTGSSVSTTTTTALSTSLTTTTSTRRPTSTVSPTSTVTATSTTLLTAYLPTRSPISTLYPVYTVSYTLTSLSLSLSTSSTNTYRQIELTSTTSTTTQVVGSSTADVKGVSTSTKSIPSTTVSLQTTTTMTASSTGAAATMGVEMGIGAVAAAAMGFAALL